MKRIGLNSYFAKYLPVEGKIEVGDSFIYKNNLYRCTRRDGHSVYHTGFKDPVKSYESKKAKLFLCSRDIKPGDNFQQESIYLTFPPYISTCTEVINKENGDIWLKCSEERLWVLYNIDYNKYLCFKVIGEISLEAKWIDEGDEFQEEQVFPIHGHNEDTGEIIYLDTEDNVVETPIYLVKSPIDDKYY